MNPLSPLLHVGFNNTVLVNQIVGIFDYSSSRVKQNVKSAEVERPRSVVNVTRGRKALSAILLQGDRYIISAIPTKALCNRLLPKNKQKPEETKDEESYTPRGREEKTSKKSNN